MQLEAALRSFAIYCGDPAGIKLHVLYAASDVTLRSFYEQLASEHPQVQFVPETNFRADLINIIRESDYVLFVVDDNVFIAPFTLGAVVDSLEAKPQALGFSLRLGKNINYCYPLACPQQAPAMSDLGDRVRLFTWVGAEHDFGYPLEVSSSVYRTKDLLPAIEADPAMRNPNWLEAQLDRLKQNFAKTHPQLLCFEQSVAFCNPLNVVQQAFQNRNSAQLQFSPANLLWLYTAGFRIDLTIFSKFTPRGCQEEVELKFKPPQLPWDELQATLQVTPSAGHEAAEATSLECSFGLRDLSHEELATLLLLLNDLQTGGTRPKSDAWLLRLSRQVQRERDRLIREASQMVGNATARLGEVSNQLQQSQNECQVLNGQVTSLKGELQSTRQECDSLKNDCAELREEVSSTDAALARTRAELTNRNAYLDQLEKGKAWLEEQYFAWKREAERLSHQHAETEQRKNRLEEDLRRIRRKKLGHRLSRLFHLVFVTRRIKKHIDYPSKWVTTLKQLPLRGWAASKTKREIQRVRVVTHGFFKRRVIDFSFGLIRHDVAQRFPQLTAAERSGFSGVAPLSRGPNIVTLQALIGDKWLSFSRRIAWRSVINRVNGNGKVNRIEDKPWPKDQPLVSVVITCYNYGRFLTEAVDSVLAQTWQDFEIIVVDDGSDDPETIRVVTSLDKPKTRVIRQKNMKLPAARNSGIRRARGKYICCLDADDKLAPTYLEKCLYRLELGSVEICSTWQQNFGNHNAVLQPPEFSLPTLLESNCLSASAVFRRDLWETVFGYDEKMVLGYEDWEFWIRMAAAGARATVIAEPLFFYRKHGVSMISNTVQRHDEIYAYITNKHRETLWTAAEIERSAPVRFDALSRYMGQRCTTVAGNRTILVAMPFLTLGGAETILSRIVRYLAKHGWRIVVISTVEPPPNSGDTTPLFEQSTAEIFHLPKFLPQQQWADFIFYLIRSRGINLVWQVGSAFTYDLLPELHRRFNHLRVVDLLFNTVGHTANNRKYAHYIDLHCVESYEVKHWLMAEGEPADRIVVIPNGVDAEELQPKDKIAAASAVAPDLKEKFVVGYFGRLSEEKGPDIFIRIADQFKDAKNVQFVLGGIGPFEPEVRKLSAQLGLNGEMRFLGQVNVREWVPCCDVIVVPSRVDGRPNIVLESLAMGVPVIASKVGGLPELVKEKDCGFLCPVGSVNGFADYISYLRGCPEHLSQMKVQARKHAVEAFPLTKTCATYDALFAKLIDSAR